MDGPNRLERFERWATTPARRRLLVAGAGGGALLLFGLGIWHRSIRVGGGSAPAPLTAVLGLVAAAMAVERLRAMVRAFRRPCRRPVTTSRGWFQGPFVLACLIGFGVWGTFDGDSTNQWPSVAMLTAGIVALALLAKWFAKPICIEDPDT